MADLLILGGTRFSGAHLTRLALDAGDHVTLFTRGKSDSPAGPLERLGSDAADRLEHVLGDRDPRVGPGLVPLRTMVEAGRRWDAVVDTSGFVPRVVRASCELLRPAADAYLFVSTVSVYQHGPEGAPDEDAPLAEPPPEGVEEVTGSTYGGLKVACEHAARDVFTADAIVTRPGLIVGPGDYTDRFTWWPRRLIEREAVLAPKTDATVQWIDGRDFAAFNDTLWRAHAGGQQEGGTFNAVARPTPMGVFVRTVRDAVGSAAEIVEADEPWLLERGVTPWADVPCWTGPDGASMGRVSSARGTGAGLRVRPLAETVRDLVAWDRARGLPGLSAGMDKDREETLIAAWRAR